MKRAVKTALLLLLLFTLYGSLGAQKKFRKYWVAGSSMFVSGMLDGTIETLVWHYDQGFKPKFPHCNDQFWDPAMSWRNKYKNGNSLDGPKFFGSTTVFVFTTDAYHLLRTTNRAITAATLVGYINSTYHEEKKKGKWKEIVLDFVILSAVRSVGFTLTYGLIFKKDPNYHRI